MVLDVTEKKLGALRPFVGQGGRVLPRDAAPAVDLNQVVAGQQTGLAAE